MFNKTFIIGKRKIGEGQPSFIVAEMSGNHNQDIHRAYEIIDAAAEAGVDAIKLQTYTPDTITIKSDKEWFRIAKNKKWGGQTLYDLYQSAYTPWDWQPKLKKYAEKKGLILFSTPFDSSAVDFLEKMKVQLYKIASFELVDIPLLRRIAHTNKPVIISRGLANIAEIKLALKTLKKNGSPIVVLLHCISSYPADLMQMNVATVSDINKRFKVLSGLSDHSLGIIASVSAITLGACVIEKHFTLSRNNDGPDASFSLEPKEMKQLVTTIRQIETAIGKVSYNVDKKEAENIKYRRSLFVVTDIKIGEKFTENNIRSIRPGNGLAPMYWDKVIGKIARKDIERGTPLSWNLIKR